MNKLAQYRMKSLKENNLDQIDHIENMINNSNGDHTSIAKSLSAHLPYKGSRMSFTSLNHTHLSLTMVDLMEILKIAMTERKHSEDNLDKAKDDMMRHFLQRLKKENKLVNANFFFFVSFALTHFIKKEHRKPDY